jgi:hypothetical protein
LGRRRADQAFRYRRRESDFLVSWKDLMTHRVLSLCALCVIFLSTPCRAQPGVCPEKITVHQQLAEPLPGWIPKLDDAPNKLAEITFYDGEPEQKASLVNDSVTRTGTTETAIWHFKPGQDRQIWLSCSYSRTAVLVTQSLPRKTSTCSVAYDPRQTVAGLPLIVQTTCK